MYIDKFQIEEMFRKIMEHAKLQQAHLEDELRLLRSQMPEQPAKYTPKNPIKPKLNCLTIKDIR